MNALDWLKIDAVNHYGYDKVSFEERIKFFDTGFDVSKADDPIQCYAAMEAYKEAIKGKSIGWGVTLDSTASGMQIMAALVHDEKAAYLTNITSDDRMDAYTYLYQGMENKPSNITRKDMKDAIMTSLYGSVNEPKRVFGEHTNRFFEYMSKAIPDVWMAGKCLESLWDSSAIAHSWTMPDGFEVYKPIEKRITKQFQFRNEYFEYYKYEQGSKKIGKSIGPDVIHSIDSLIVRELHRRCNYSHEVVHKALHVVNGGSCSYTRKDIKTAEKLKKLYDETGFLSYAILEVMNKHTLAMFGEKTIAKMLKDMPIKAFPILAIHDSFKVHPNYANDLREQYKQIIHQLLDSNLFQYFVRQITGTDIVIGINRTITKEQANCYYAIC